jgi:hypothetical protein
LSSDDPVLDLVVDVLWNDFTVGEIVLSVVRPVSNYSFGSGSTNTWQLVEFLG